MSAGRWDLIVFASASTWPAASAVACSTSPAPGDALHCMLPGSDSRDHLAERGRSQDMGAAGAAALQNPGALIAGHEVIGMSCIG